MLSFYRQVTESSFFRKKVFFSVQIQGPITWNFLYLLHTGIFFFYFTLPCLLKSIEGKFKTAWQSQITVTAKSTIFCVLVLQIRAKFFQIKLCAKKKDIIYLAYRGEKLTCFHRRGTFTALMTSLIFTNVAKPLY